MKAVKTLNLLLQSANLKKNFKILDYALKTDVEC